MPAPAAAAIRVTGVELRAGDARVVVLPEVGGAIASFTFRGRDVLRPMPAGARAAGNVRLAASYPLVPYSNRIRDARLAFAGGTHALARNFGDHPHAIHGVGWQRAWTVDASGATPAHATLRYAHRPRASDASPHAAGDGAGADDAARAWPWPFDAAQSFALDARDPAACLTVTLSLANAGAASFPFGLGWHPFFPREQTTTLAFVARDVALNDATQLPVERAPAQGRYDFRVPRAPGDATIDNVFSGWDGVARLAYADGRVTTVEADRACDRLVVYAPAGGDFVAVEPVTHDTDAFNREAAGERGTGARTLGPGRTFSCTMRIACRLAPAA